MKRLKYVVAVNPPLPRDRIPLPDDEVSFLPMERIGDDGTLDLSERRPAREVCSGYTAMLDGDLVIAKITPCFENGKGAICRGMQGGIGFGTTELIVLRPKYENDPQFLYWVTHSSQFRGWGEAEMRGSAGQKRVTEQFVSNFRTSILNVVEQQTIAAFLNEQTTKIDRLIALRRRQMELLREQRAAVIEQAVTRGLDPDAPMKDSGLPWLGEVPAHWDTMHLKRLLSAVDYGISDRTNVEGAYICLRMGDIVSGEISYDEVAYVAAVEERLLLSEGDLVFNRTNSLEQIGKVAIFRQQADRAVTFASYLVRLRSVPDVVPEYLNYALNSDRVLAWARSEAIPAIGQVNLNPRRYCMLRVAKPPVAEQLAIARYCNRIKTQVNDLLSAYARQIELLTEYRAALIHECVTGQRVIGAEAEALVEAA